LFIQEIKDIILNSMENSRLRDPLAVASSDLEKKVKNKREREKRGRTG
jgi:hypothetical protein